MPKQLSQIAIDAINNDAKLFTTICDLLEVKPGTLVSHLQRNSERLHQYLVVMAISQALEIPAESVLEEKPEKEAEPVQ